MGLLWLSTVPLTSGLVALMFGLRYMATLFGFVLFSHQVGSFMASGSAATSMSALALMMSYGGSGLLLAFSRLW